MKKIFTFLIILFFAISAGAQIGYQTIFDFEDGVDTTIWIPFANGVGTKADLNVVENPLANNVNSSDSVLWMHIYTDAEGWVGYWVDLDTLEIDGIYGNVEISEESYMMSLMVYKPVSYTHLRAHETVLDLVCRLLLEQKKKHIKKKIMKHLLNNATMHIVT